MWSWPGLAFYQAWPYPITFVFSISTTSTRPNLFSIQYKLTAYKSRLNDTVSKELIDIEIISDKRLNTIGYKVDIDNGQTNAHIFNSSPHNQDTVRYPIGFSVSEGKLTKFAEPTSTDAGSISSCENWAGINPSKMKASKSLLITKRNCCGKRSLRRRLQRLGLKVALHRINSIAGTPMQKQVVLQDRPKTVQNLTKTVLALQKDAPEMFGLDGEFVGFTKKTTIAHLNQNMESSAPNG